MKIYGPLFDVSWSKMISGAIAQYYFCCCLSSLEVGRRACDRFIRYKFYEQLREDFLSLIFFETSSLMLSYVSLICKATELFVLKSGGLSEFSAIDSH